MLLACNSRTAAAQTVSVPEGKDSADALRIALDHLDYETVVVISGDLVTDIPVQARAETCAHAAEKATRTEPGCMLCRPLSARTS